MKAITFHASGMPSPKEAEVWAISWIHHLNIHNVIFELDCISVVDSFNSCSEGITEFNLILNRCRVEFQFISNSRLNFVKRLASN
ncbi:hypothetical protein GmHk_10G027500 [Glycine max]|nr:hypothetical protein GmHk_10G027500 [Glycine max]